MNTPQPLQPYRPTTAKSVMTEYIYDASGNRVAKGPITTWSCDPSTNGLEASAQETDYIINQSGQQVTEMTQDGSTMEWQHTNVWIGGQVLATYQASTTSAGKPSSNLHFYLNDWLGTRRVMTDYAGVVEQQCASLPYGDYESCNPTPTEQLFTGKQRDSESGNDYFGARYYAENDARFLSPDSVGGDPENPQSWNLYSYVYNNPLTNTDPSGHDVNVCSTDSYGNQQCHEMTNEQYQAAQQAGNGGLNVPTLDQVGNSKDANGNFTATNITDANGNTVGTATYVPTNPGIDPFVGNNMAGYQTLGAANKVVTYGAVGTAVVFGGVAVAAAGPEVAVTVGRWGLQRLAMGASSPALINLINRLYQAQDEIPGGTAGAVRNEVMTGEYINGGHSIKASEMITALQRLINSGQLSARGCY